MIPSQEYEAFLRGLLKVTTWMWLDVMVTCASARQKAHSTCTASKLHDCYTMGNGLPGRIRGECCCCCTCRGGIWPCCCKSACCMRICCTDGLNQLLGCPPLRLLLMWLRPPLGWEVGGLEARCWTKGLVRGDVWVSPWGVACEGGSAGWALLFGTAAKWRTRETLK